MLLLGMRMLRTGRNRLPAPKNLPFLTSAGYGVRAEPYQLRLGWWRLRSHCTGLRLGAGYDVGEKRIRIIPSGTLFSLARHIQFG